VSSLWGWLFFLGSSQKPGSKGDHRVTGVRPPRIPFHPRTHEGIEGNGRTWAILPQQQRSKVWEGDGYLRQRVCFPSKRDIVLGAAAASALQRVLSPIIQVQLTVVIPQQWPLQHGGQGAEARGTGLWQSGISIWWACLWRSHGHRPGMQAPDPWGCLVLTGAQSVRIRGAVAALGVLKRVSSQGAPRSPLQLPTRTHLHFQPLSV
jgi:hypothetical protein